MSSAVFNTELNRLWCLALGNASKLGLAVEYKSFEQRQRFKERYLATKALYYNEQPDFDVMSNGSYPLPGKFSLTCVDLTKDNHIWAAL